MPILVFEYRTKFTNGSQNAWWHKTGPMLAKVLSSANYTLEEQLEYLEFFSKTLVPQFGPYPQVFRSSITRSGLPLELSINYQQHGKPPVHSRVCKIEGFNVQLWNQALKDHTVNDAEQASLRGTDIEGGYIRSQTAFGFDLIKGGKISVKGYTFPALKCKVTGKSMAQVMADSVRNMQHLVDCSQAFSMVNAYLKATAYDERSFFSWDFVNPSKSRLKLYTGSNNVTWEKLQEVWTLGGRLRGSTVAKGLEYLNQLFNLIKLKEGERSIEVAFDDRKNSSKTTPLLWNYEMRAADPNPLTKIYFPVHGENDMQVITGVAQFFRMIGLVELGNSYVAKVQSY
ncbi:predicted protein [Uncinocarpus reesii 1704]|uniref:Uncharacterized protein n=1 Tax=Uncinocarpus reesii (strain UAMH 1704) TaxID=336963 RepID=C4JZR2_UNCRE|nr:uncharacterized protein UREG_07663 [Uncinocarpus reesii 1704]EEP82798.1 predicted protein [Uncinocarpus reesii 1704]